MSRRSVVVATAVALCLPAFTGCSGSSSHDLDDVSMGGTKLTAPDKLLTTAQRAFLSANQSAIDSKAAIVADTPRCYFRRSQKDSDEVLQKVFCGPIRRAGKDTSHVWDTYGVATHERGRSTALATKDAPLATVTGAEKTSTVVDTSLLVRPDGKSPADATKLAAPKAPRSSLSNYAAVVSSSRQQTGLSFKTLDTPAVLRTPSATITVTATATSKTVPGWFESLDTPASETGADGGNVAKDYRPQKGQSVLAYRITVGPGAAYPDSNDSSNDNPKDASTALSLQIGGQNLTIHDMGGSDDGSYTDDDSNSTLTVSCSSLPCNEDDDAASDTTSYVLIASAPAGDAELAASVDGQTQTLSLTDGTVDGDVSDVTATRNNPSQQVNTTIPSSSVKVSFDEYTDGTYDIGGSVPTVFLTSFDANAGWAPEGKAWLEVPIQNLPDNWGGNDFSVNWAKTNTLVVGKKTYHAHDSAGLDGTAVFEVPDSFTNGTFRYQPQGTATGGYPEVTKPFKAKKPYEVKISIPAK